MSPAETLVNEVSWEGRRTMRKTDEAGPERRGQQTLKRPYEPPMIVSERILKSTAVALGKRMAEQSLATAGLRAS
jgi:hypothetical protein